MSQRLADRLRKVAAKVDSTEVTGASETKRAVISAIESGEKAAVKEAKGKDEDALRDMADAAYEELGADAHALMTTAKVLVNYADKKDVRHYKRWAQDLQEDLDRALHMLGRAGMLQEIAK